jgi:hypothetical protein
MSYECKWPSCKGIEFSAYSFLIDHQKIHCKGLIEAAKYDASLRCGWHGCNTQKPKVFENFAALRKHIKEHVKSYLCVYTDCNISFARKSDLQRHIKSKHTSEPEFRCPIETCDRNTNAFSRKDKLDEHTRKTHENFRCPLDHCGVQVLESAINKHLDKYHGDGKVYEATYGRKQKSGSFECAFPGCESTTSKFNYDHAYQHLRRHHLIQDDYTPPNVIRRAQAAGPVASRGDAFVLDPLLTRTRPYLCKICTKTRGTENDVAVSASLAN